MPMIDGSTPVVANALIFASGFDAELRGALRRHHEHGGRAVVEARGVGGRHRAVLRERGLQAGDRIERRAGLDELVGRRTRPDRPCAAGSSPERSRPLNLPAFCAASALFWLATANSSCCAREMPYLLRDVLGGRAHVVLVVDVPQAVDDHRVDRACASPIRNPSREPSSTCGEALMFSWPPAMTMSASPLWIACAAQHHRLQARVRIPALIVDRRDRMWNARLDQRLARRILAAPRR